MAFFVCKYKIPKIFGKFKLKKVVKLNIRKQFISYSWPLMFSHIILSIFYWIDSFSIGYFLDVSQVGFYNEKYANWQNKNEKAKIEDSNLFISNITVDSGRQLKRIRPAPQGRAHRIRKRSNHVILSVNSKNNNDILIK